MESKVINFDNHLFRCHALGKINGDYKNAITESQLKKLSVLQERPSFSSKEKGCRTEIMESEMLELIAKKNAPKELPDTCTSYLEEIYESVVHDYKKKVKTKEMDKGLRCEQSGFTMLQQTLFHNRTLPILKNKEEKSSKYFVGSCDTSIPPIIVDVKNCWDWFTFNNSDQTSLYFAQLQGYGKLWKAEKLILFFCLCNMTEDQFINEETKLFYRGNDENPNGFLSRESPEYMVACEKMRDEYNFERFPIWQRFKTFEFDYDPYFIEKMEARIIECRIWLNNYHQQKLEFYNGNKLLMGLKQ